MLANLRQNQIIRFQQKASRDEVNKNNSGVHIALLVEGHLGLVDFGFVVNGEFFHIEDLCAKHKQSLNGGRQSWYVVV